MSLTDEVVDLCLVVNDEWLEVGQVEVFRTLRLWKYEVEEEEEAEPRVEGQPAYDEHGPGLSQ